MEAHYGSVVSVFVGASGLGWENGRAGRGGDGQRMFTRRSSARVGPRTSRRIEMGAEKVGA